VRSSLADYNLEQRWLLGAVRYIRRIETEVPIRLRRRHSAARDALEDPF
jgi:hypothetical protein